MKPTYESPLASRYASKTMLHLFSPDMRYETWRRLWVALARAEHTLGLPVTQQQVDELAAHVSPIDYDVVAAREKEVRHDVMAHIYAYGLDAPGAKGVIHLGATSCYVTDNADLILYREALRYLEKELKAAMRMLGFADVVEVAIGADLCTVEEANDFLEEVPAKQPWMGTSCCPAWSMMAKTLFPEFKDYISMALTPMVITARMVKKDHPNARIVFIGPCAAKKLEAIREDIRSDVDFVLTFEELNGMFEAKEIDFATIEPMYDLNQGTAAGRGFAVAGGVAKAVEDLVHETHPEMEIKTARAEGLRECRKLMTLAKAGKYNGYLLEGMACPGGCVAGAGTILHIDKAQKFVEKYSKEAASASPLESPYRHAGEHLD